MSEIATTTPSQAAREFLLASLLDDSDDGSITFDDDRYIDWSVPVDRDDPDSGRVFEIQDPDGDLVQLPLSWAEIERLQRALTITLLNR